MAEQQYYQVPDEVAQYYPSLVDDYIRAAQGAYAGSQDSGYDPWADVAGGLAKGVAGGVTSYLAEEQKGRLAEAAANRTSERAYELDRRKSEHAHALAQAKAKIEADEAKRVAGSQAEGMARWFELRRPTRGDARPAAAAYIEDIADPSRTPNLEGQVPPEINFQGPLQKPPADPMATFGQMFAEDPARAYAAMEGFLKTGEKGAMMEGLKGTLTPYHLEQKAADVDWTRGRAAESWAGSQRKDQAEGRLQEAQDLRKEVAGMAADFKQLGLEIQSRGVATREAAVGVQERFMALRERMEAFEQRLKDSQINRNDAAAEKARTGGGAKALSARDQALYDNTIMPQVTREFPHYTPAQHAEEAHQRLRENNDPLNRKIRGKLAPSTAGAPPPATPGPAPTGPTQGDDTPQQALQQKSPRYVAELVVGRARSLEAGLSALDMIPGLSPQGKERAASLLRRRFGGR